MHEDDQAPDGAHTQDVEPAVTGDAPNADMAPESGPDTSLATAPADALPAVPDTAPLDLDAIQQDLADVEVALARLDAGTYWTDEVTGEALPPELLAEHPTARRT